MQAIGIALLSLHGAEFMDQPRKVCQVNMPMYKPEAHGQLLKLAKVSFLKSKLIAEHCMGHVRLTSADRRLRIMTGCTSLHKDHD